MNQLISAAITNSGSFVNSFAYSYDLTANRLSEQIGATNDTSTYNALNQISTSTHSGVSRTNEWDARNQLVAVSSGIRRTEFTYDGLCQLTRIRLLTNGVEASLRRFVWFAGRMREERDAAGLVTKRFFSHGVRVESGPLAGIYYYTRDHLGSVREVTDGSGTVRARYAYDPYGRRMKLSGDAEADFGFAGMFWSPEVKLSLTHHRAYDPELGRWLSRDPLESAELREGPNLYAYVRNEPINRRDSTGLGFDTLSTKAGVAVMLTIAAEEGGEELEGAGEAATEKAAEIGEAAIGALEGAAQRCVDAFTDTAPVLQNAGTQASQIFSRFPLAGTDPRILADPRFPSIVNMLNDMSRAGNQWFTPELGEALGEFDALSWQYLNELTSKFVATHGGNGSLSFMDAMRLAYKMALDELGADPFYLFP